MKYRKKPVVVEAIQYDGHNAKTIKSKLKDIKLFVHQSISYSTTATSSVILVPIEEIKDVDLEISVYPIVYISTLEGDMIVRICDWIIKGIAGEFYPCKPDIFEKTYERFEEI